jgi:hypothetical protein
MGASPNRSPSISQRLMEFTMPKHESLSQERVPYCKTRTSTADTNFTNWHDWRTNCRARSLRGRTEVRC